MSKKYLVTQDQTVDGMPLESDSVIHYTVCSTAAAAAAKTAALSGFKLVTGAMAAVRFAVTNTAANPTLNINGTGAKAVRYRNAAVSAGVLAANRTYFMVYDGSYWQIIGDLDTNTTYSDMTGASASAAGKTGLVPAPAAGAQNKYLRGDGTWHASIGIERVVDASFDSNGFKNTVNSSASYFQVIVECTSRAQQAISHCYVTPLLPLSNDSVLHLSTSNMPAVPYCLDGSSYVQANFITVKFTNGAITVNGGCYGAALKDDLPLVNHGSTSGTVHLYWYY